ncbi:hypothetical protein [Streptomyces sp. CA-106131]|uniref:hypothetical protein n=1 Tax=Streptomyces sp. CA-106131 TaxID=3240045 RepID=UPI003D8D471C
MSDTGFFRGEGGAVWEFDLPLAPLLQSALDKGLLTPVEPPKAERPAAAKKTPAKAPSKDADKS